MFITLALVVLAGSALADEQKLVDRLLASWAQVRTFSCSIRKETMSESGTAQMLSRVHYERPNHIHVENTKPLSRRIIADGATLYYHEEGMAEGVRKPIRDLTDEWSILLRSVPGSPMEHLLHLGNAPETPVPPMVDFPLRRGYALSNRFVVLSCDALDRLCRVEIFNDTNMTDKAAMYDYSSFVQVATNCWLPRVQSAVFIRDKTRTEEIRRLDNAVVNQPVSPVLFQPERYFKGISFTNRFEDE